MAPTEHPASQPETVSWSGYLTAAEAVAASATELTSLGDSLRQLAEKLSSLQDARRQKQNSFERLAGTTLGLTPELAAAQLSRKSSKRGRVVMTTTLSKQSTVASSVDDDGVQSPLMMRHGRAVRWSIDLATIDRGAPMLSTGSDESAVERQASVPENREMSIPVDRQASVLSTWSIESGVGRRRSAGSPRSFEAILDRRASALSSMSMAYSATTFEDPCVDEVVDLICGAMERGSVNAREIFNRFCCLGSEILQKSDLEKLVKFLAPELTQAQHSQLWEALHKDDDDLMTFEEFQRVVGMPASPEASPWRQAGALPLDRQERIIFYRVGRTWLQSAVACEELEKLDVSGQNEMTLQQLLQLSGRYRLPLSRAEIVTFFSKHAHGEEMSTAALWDAIEVASADPPPEIQWAKQAIAAAGVKARATGRGIGSELVPLGDAEAAPFHELRQVLAPHLSLNEERWEALEWALDKRQDDAIVLEPVVQLATRMCSDDPEGQELYEHRHATRTRSPSPRRRASRLAAILPGLREDDEVAENARSLEGGAEDEQR